MKKRHRKAVLAALLAISLIWLIGCSVGKMARRDMYIAPKFDKDQAIQYSFWDMPYELEYGDPARIVINGRNFNSFVWQTIVFTKGEEGKTERKIAKAVRVINVGKPKLLPQLPGDFKLKDDDVFVISDHGNTVMFDRSGLRLDRDWNDYDPFDEKTGGFGTKVKNAGFRIALPGTPEHDELRKISMNDFLNTVEQEKKYIYSQLGVKEGSPLSEKQLDMIDRKGWNHWLKRFFLSDWKAAVIWNVLAPAVASASTTTPVSLIVFKAWTLYEEAWSQGFKESGYMRGNATREENALALKQFHDNLNLENVSKEDYFRKPLPPEITGNEIFQRSPCSNATTSLELTNCMLRLLDHSAKDKVEMRD